LSITHLAYQPPKSQTAVINSGMFKDREVEILPQDYLDQHYCLIRDCEFQIDLTIRRDQLDNPISVRR